MLKKLMSLMLASILFMASFNVTGFAETPEEFLVVNAASINTSRESGLTLSQMYTKSGEYTLRWSDIDVSRNVKLPCAEDFSGGEYLEFWVYSTMQSNSSFAVSLISDNPDTACIDYYKTVVDAPQKGWQLISIPMSQMDAVYTPKGLNSIDCVELWPVYGKYQVNSAAILYIDNMYVRKEQTQAQEIESTFVLCDLSSQSAIESLNINNGKITAASTGNVYIDTNTPDIGGTALCWSDKTKAGADSSNGMDFRNLAAEDFSPYNTMKINVYSKEASGDIIRLVLWSDADVDTNDNKSNSYYYQDIVVDWTGLKEFSIQLGSMQQSNNAVVGLNYINRLSLWAWTFNRGDSLSTNLYFKNIILENVNYDELWNNPIYLTKAETRADDYDFAARINERFPNNKHPRLLATSEDIDYIKNNYKNDEFLSKSVDLFIKNADKYKLSVATPADTETAGRGAATLALAYLLTGDEEYKAAVWDRMKVLTTDTTTWDPASSELSVGDTSRYVALTYDLMYNDWTESERMIVRNAMIMYALEPQWSDVFRNNSGHGDGVTNADTNWNAIINSGLGMCALAIADTPGYEYAANQYLNRLYLGVKNLFRHYADDGAGFEGTDYWGYTMSGYLPYENALYNSVGAEDYERFSVLDEYGMGKTGDYILHMHGTPNGGLSFNYYDGSPRLCTSMGDFWLARYFNRPEFGGLLWENPAGSVYEVLMYRDSVNYKNWRTGDLPLDYYGGGEAQVGSMRASFDKGNSGLYVGYKGNLANTATHGRLDAGAFVLDAMGKRWIELFSSENYNLPGMFGADRYKYYRNRAEGSNTLVIGAGIDQGSNKENNPQAQADVVSDQVHFSNAPIIETGSEPWAAYGIVDLTDAYKVTADSVKRGFALINSRNSFLLQDEIETSQIRDVHSYMHTSSEVEVADDGLSAILTNGDSKLKVSLMSTCNAKLKVEEAAALPTSPNVQNTLNTGYRKLTVEAEVDGSAKIALIFSPYLGEGSYEFSLPDIVSLDNWKAFLDEPVKINSIYLDGVELADFEPNKTMYTLSEERTGLITASADDGIQLKITQAQNVGDSAVILADDGESENPTSYVINFSDRVQTDLDNWTSYPPKALNGSANLADLGNIIDGDYNTEWANEGSQWVIFDLGKEKEVYEVQLYWKNQHLRQETFDIATSVDGENWKTVWSGESILSSNMESYDFERHFARYVRVTGYENTVNNWTTIMEMRVTYSGSSFDDLDGCWAKTEIEEMGKVGIVEGTSDRIYSPDETLTRAQFLTMLSRVYEVDSASYSGAVSDIAQDEWYTPFIEGAYKKGLIPNEMLYGGFKPDAFITREEAAALCVSYYENLKASAKGTSIEHFTDVSSVSAWAKPYVEKSVALRFMNGQSDGSFKPHGLTTRAEAAAMMKRIYIKTK